MNTQTRPPAPTKKSDLSIRIVGGVLFAIPLVLGDWLGGWWFAGLMAIAALIVSYETHQLLRAAGHTSNLFWLLAFAACSFAAALGQLPAPLLLGIAFALLLGSAAYQLSRPVEEPLTDWALALAMGAYLGGTCGVLAAVRQLDGHAWWVGLAFGATWLADSGAYLVGKRFGKRKLAPHISPGKTVEGYLGGVLGGVLGGGLIGLLAPFGVAVGALAGLLVGLFSIFGDLFESLLKRQAKLKDSGHFIPGHGGLFDRIDSLLWSGVLIYFLHQLLSLR